MRRIFAFLAFLAMVAHGYAAQYSPAQTGIDKQSTASGNFSVLDNTNTWVPIGILNSTSHSFTPYSTMIVGTSTISSGTLNGLLYDNGGVLGNLATANFGVLVTNASGVPSISTTLPNMAIGTPTSINLANATNLPISSISSLGTGVATALAQPVSATGTGIAIYNGTLTNGDCVSINAGRFVDAGGACTTGGGGGTVSAGTANQLAYYASSGTTVVGLTTANSGVLVTSAGGVPFISTTLPNIALGTPTSITLTNGTGLPIAGLTGLGTGVASALAANVTGSGEIVLATAPSIAGGVLSGTFSGTPTFSGGITMSSTLSVTGGTSTVSSASSSAFQIIQALDAQQAALVFDGTGNVNKWAIAKNTNNHLVVVDSANSFANFLDVATGGNATLGESGATITIPSTLLVTGAFTATGLVTNADLVNSSTTVNGQTCTLGATCTVTASASSITVGSTTIGSGITNGLLYDNAGTLQNLTTANSGVLVTSAAGVPSISTTLPNVAHGTPTSITLTNGTGLPIAGLTGLGTGVATALAANVTGSGGIVLATAPSIAGGALSGTFSGTPTFSGGITMSSTLSVTGGTSTVSSASSSALQIIQALDAQQAALVFDGTGNVNKWAIAKDTNNHLIVVDSANGFANFLDVATGGNATLGEAGATVTIPSTLLVTGAFTATGLVTNADLVNSSTTVNGQSCTLGATCTISAAASSIIVGTSTITGGTSNGLLYDNAGVLGNLATANSGVLVTSAGGVPSISTTLPNIALGTPTSITLTNGTGLPVSTGISGLGTGVATALAAGVSGTGNIVLASGSTISGLTASSSFTASATTQSTSSTTGAAVISGGLGVAKNIFGAGSISVGAVASDTNPGYSVEAFPTSGTFAAPAFNFNDQSGVTSTSDLNTHFAMSVFGGGPSTGTGSYTGLIVNQYGTNRDSGAFITGAQETARAIAGSTNLGNYTGNNPYVQIPTGMTALSSAVGEEIDTEIHSSVYVKEGLRIADLGGDSDGCTFDICAAIDAVKVPSAHGYKYGIRTDSDIAGTDSGFPVASGGTMWIARTTSLQLYAGIDWGLMKGGFSSGAAFILPNNTFIASENSGGAGIFQLIGSNANVVCLSCSGETVDVGTTGYGAILQMQNNTAITSVNAAGTGTLSMIYADGSNNIILGGTNVAGVKVPNLLSLTGTEANQIQFYTAVLASPYFQTWQVNANIYGSLYIYDASNTRVMQSFLNNGTIAFNQLTGSGSAPLCVNLNGVIERGSISAGLVTCP